MPEPTPADNLHIKLLAETHIDDSEVVVPMEATKDMLKCWPNIVNDTDPEAGFVPYAILESTGAEYVNKTNELLRN